MQAAAKTPLRRPNGLGGGDRVWSIVFGNAIGNSVVDGVRPSEADSEKYKLWPKDSGRLRAGSGVGLDLGQSAADEFGDQVLRGLAQAQQGTAEDRNPARAAAGFDAERMTQAIVDGIRNGSDRPSARPLAVLAANERPGVMTDALGNFIGTPMDDVPVPTMSYGKQMRNVGRFMGDLGLGSVKGVANLIPETLAFGARMTGYAAGGVAGLFNTDVADALFADADRVNGRLFPYDNGVQESAGVAAQLASPLLMRGAAVAGARLYELESNFVLGSASATVGNGVQRGPVVLDLFGGRASQTSGAINVDIVAQEGVSASAMQLPFKSGVADQVIASNPYIKGGNGMMDFLPEATRVLKPEGELILNSTVRNPFGVLPDAEVLNSLGLRVIQRNGPLLPQFENNVFRFTDGRVIPNTSVRSTVLKKVGP